MFKEKLNLLMNITNTKNNTLSEALSFDSSYISRIRTGSRNVPKNNKFIDKVAHYFAYSITKPYQKAAITKAINKNIEWPDDPAEAYKLLYLWLADVDEASNFSVGKIIEGFNNHNLVCTTELPERQINKITKNDYFIGDTGKSEAIINILENVCALDTTPNLLISFDRNIRYLKNSPETIIEINELLSQYLKKGGHITMIHPVSNDFKKMLDNVVKWLPLYMTGEMEPFWYPDTKDNVFKRTIIVAEGKYGLSHIAVEDNTSESITQVTNNKVFVKALEYEYKNYLSLCKPIFNVYNTSKINMFNDVMKNYRYTLKNRIILENTFAIYTIPMEIIDRHIKETNNKRLFNLYNESLNAFKNHLDNGLTTYEIVSLPKISDVSKKGFDLTIGYIDKPVSIKYTIDDLALHISNIIKLLKEYENYNIIVSTINDYNMHIYSVENHGTIIARNYPSPIAFVISEPKMTSSFYDYLSSNYLNNVKKNKTITLLNNYLKKLIKKSSK